MIAKVLEELENPADTDEAKPRNPVGGQRGQHCLLAPDSPRPDSRFLAPLGTCVRSISVPVHGRDSHGRGRQAQLRVLRPGSATGIAGRADLLLRVHVLRRLRGTSPRRPLPKLRRRTGSAPRPSPGRLGAEPTFDAARPPRDTLPRRRTSRELLKWPHANAPRRERIRIELERAPPLPRSAVDARSTEHGAISLGTSELPPRLGALA